MRPFGPPQGLDEGLDTGARHGGPGYGAPCLGGPAEVSWEVMGLSQGARRARDLGGAIQVEGKLGLKFPAPVMDSAGACLALIRELTRCTMSCTSHDPGGQSGE